MICSSTCRSVNFDFHAMTAVTSPWTSKATWALMPLTSTSVSPSAWRITTSISSCPCGVVPPARLALRMNDTMSVTSRMSYPGAEIPSNSQVASRLYDASLVAIPALLAVVQLAAETIYGLRRRLA
jgi:hypothetical protein